jgi:phosphoribulokinase
MVPAAVGVAMSIKHPIISITGSSGAGTSSVKQTFEQIFRREKVEVAYVEGDSFHRYDRDEMKTAMAEAQARGNAHFSHFGPQANLLGELEKLFKEYGETGTGRYRHYVHDENEAAVLNSPPGTFTPWRELPANTDLLFYEGLHGAVVTEEVNVARYADLKIGVVPVINLEWTQKLHRDRNTRGYTTEAVTETILRRMHDYVYYICPQFSETDINFQRAATVDTSNPFVARSIPSPDESIVVIRFRDPRGVDFPYLVTMIAGSWMSRANSIVIPGNKLDLAMQLILTPRILELMKRKRGEA